MEHDGLKPCPFCGGDAQTMCMDLDSIEEGWQVWGVWCMDDLYAEEHGGYQHGHYIDNYATEAEAIAAWNTRHAGTCELHGCEGRISTASRPVWLCDCGAFMAEYTDADTYHKPRYCPNCGRKVER